MADEIRIVKHAAAQHNVVFVLGHAHAVLPKDTKLLQIPRRLLLEMPYKVSGPKVSQIYSAAHAPSLSQRDPPQLWGRAVLPAHCCSGRCCSCGSGGVLVQVVRQSVAQSAWAGQVSA